MYVYFLTKEKLDKINLSNTMFITKINIEKENTRFNDNNGIIDMSQILSRQVI